MRELHVATAQCHAVAARPRENLARMERQIRSAAAVGVEAILFAETGIHGYAFTPANLALAEAADGPSAARLRAWAEEMNIAILAGMLERDGEAIYNSHLVVTPGAGTVVQRKHRLTPGEKEAGLAPGPAARTTFLLREIRCAVLICADSGIEGVYDTLLEQGVELRFHPCAGGGTLEEMMHEDELASEAGARRYAEDRAKVFVTDAIQREADQKPHAFVAANALGFDGVRACHRGHCTIADRFGTIRAQIPGTNVLEHQLDQMAHAVLRFP